MKIQIVREKWLRGEGVLPSRLLRPSDGKMCCLGQACLTFGLKPQDISGITSPANVRADLAKCDNGEYLLSGGNSSLAVSMMLTNDSMEITDAEREAKLMELFAQTPDTIEFVNESEVQ